MPESPPLHDGQTRIFRSASGSAYEVKNVGGSYSCNCPAWRNQSRHPNYRTCKHLVDFRGAEDEALRIAPGGRESMPSTVARLVFPHWPGSGAGRTRDIATGRLPAEPTSTPGGRAIRYETGTTVKFKVKKAPLAPPEPPKKHNAWTALLDDDHPLAEPTPPPPPAAANDVVTVKAVPADEPEWSAPSGAAVPLDPASFTAPVATRGAFRGVLLAQEWDGVQNVTGWIMSEKLDGVRAYWDGERFYSRNGNIFSVPDWYRDQMPKDMHLDGEFWLGRGQFQKTSGYVRRMDRGEYWRNINYMVFDGPSAAGGFEERLALVMRATLPAHCKVLPHAACPSIETLRTYLAAVEEQGGEGVMLRQPGSRYVRTRSASLLKVKTFFDTEVRVTGTTAGKGRHLNAVGALEVRVDATVKLGAGKKLCTLVAGTEFEVGTGLVDAQRRPGAIPIGSIITVRFQELSSDGIPRFPSLIGVRNYE